METIWNRLDIAIAQQEKISRQKAKEAIQGGLVSVNGKIITKASYEVKETDALLLTPAEISFVSRGGFKLQKALGDFQIEVQDQICLDIGASTGGFTDCLLQHGAQKVYAIDVGTAQLAQKLLDDPRVISMENLNVKQLRLDMIGEAVDLVTMDLSFISITKVLDYIKPLLKKDGKLICLIKPQFETGGPISKDGVIKDKKIHKRILNTLFEYFETNQWQLCHFTSSPITGQKGNVEYLACLKPLS